MLHVLDGTIPSLALMVRQSNAYGYLTPRYHNLKAHANGWRRVLCHLQQRQNGNIFAIDVQTEAGFFGVLTHFIHVVAHCSATGRKPHIRLTGSYYRSSKRNPDWFTNYFYWKDVLSADEKDRVARGEIVFTPVGGAKDLGLMSRYRVKLRDAHSLFNRYVGIRREIIDEVDDRAGRMFGGSRVLGLHYRGTDKWMEAPRSAYKDVRGKVVRFLRCNPSVEKLFLATDEADFIEFMRIQDFGIPVVWPEDHEVAIGVRPVFVTDGDRYRRGREALVTSLLLARCHYCIKTSSYLSAWSKVFNPELPVALLNQPFKWTDDFGDREIGNKQFMIL